MRYLAMVDLDIASDYETCVSLNFLIIFLAKPFNLVFYLESLDLT